MPNENLDLILRGGAGLGQTMQDTSQASPMRRQIAEQYQARVRAGENPIAVAREAKVREYLQSQSGAGAQPPQGAPPVGALAPMQQGPQYQPPSAPPAPMQQGPVQQVGLGAPQMPTGVPMQAAAPAPPAPTGGLSNPTPVQSSPHQGYDYSNFTNRDYDDLMAAKGLMPRAGGTGLGLDSRMMLQDDAQAAAAEREGLRREHDAKMKASELEFKKSHDEYVGKQKKVMQQAGFEAADQRLDKTLASKLQMMRERMSQKQTSTTKSELGNVYKEAGKAIRAAEARIAQLIGNFTFQDNDEAKAEVAQLQKRLRGEDGRPGLIAEYDALGEQLKTGQGDSSGTTEESTSSSSGPPFQGAIRIRKGDRMGWLKPGEAMPAGAEKVSGG